MTAVTDPLGRTVAYEYDLLDRPVRVTAPDPDGAGPLEAPVSHVAYDALGRLLAEQDAVGSTTRYRYDHRHRLTDVLAPLGATTNLAYDPAGQVVATTDAEGRTTTYAYDDAGRTTAVTLPGQTGTPLTTTYDTLSNPRTTTDQLGRQTRYEYDNQSRLVKTTYNVTGAGTPNANADENLTTQYAYNDDGLVASITELVGWDPTGGGSAVYRSTSYIYDGAGRIATVTLPSATHDSGTSSPEIHVFYDGFGRTQYEVDPLGNVTEHHYDKLHRPTKTTGEDPAGTPRYNAGVIAAASGAGPVTEYAYDAAGQLTSVTDPLDRVMHYDYDELGRMVRSVAPNPTDGSEWTLARDPYDSEGVPFTRYEYDAAGRVTATRELESYDSGAYTYVGNDYTYDALHRLVSETDAVGANTTYTYDLVGNLTSLTDPVLNTTSWAYDDLNRVASETNQLGHSRLYQYDLASRLTSKTDRLGRVTTYGYDDANRPLTEQWFADAADTTADHTLTFTYDHAGRMLTSSDTAHSYSYAYDDLDRLTSRTLGVTGLTEDVVIDRSYDAAGRLVGTQAAFVAGATTTADYANAYAYDNLHRLLGVTQHTAGVVASGDHDVATKHAAYTYDLAGQLETITRFTGATLASGTYTGNAGTEVATTNYAYDGAGRLDKIEHFQGADANAATGTLVAGYGYTFDHRSRLEEIDFLVGNAGYTSPAGLDYTAEDVTYTYDNRGQLTTADYATTANDEAYGYDANGNRTTGIQNTGGTSDYTTGADNRLTSDGTYRYEYDAEGNRTLRYVDADGSGTYNAGDTDVTEYTWDHRNRLTRVTDRATHGGPATQTVDHAYDASNRWVRRQVDANGDGAVDSQTLFVHDLGQIVLQLDATGAGDLTKADLTHRYLWGPGVDQLIVDEAVASLTDASQNTRQWAATDHLGSVRDVLDDAGAVLNHVTYDSYGRVTAETDAAVESLFGYTGKPLDETTGLQSNWRRWYDAEAGRWISQDPIGFAAGDANLSRYVSGTPTQYRDPTGEQTLHDHHLFVNEFITIFKNDFTELDIDEFAVIISKELVHNGVDPTSDLAIDLAESGLSRSRGGRWNSRWKLFLNSDGYKACKNKQRALLSQLFQMSDDFGIDLSDVSRYGRAKNAANNARALSKILELSEKYGVDLSRYKQQVTRMLTKLASTDVGQDVIRRSTGPLRKLLSGKGVAGKVPWLAAALFVATASNEGGAAAAADLIGVDRNVVRNFVEGGGIEIAVSPWLLYESIESEQVGARCNVYDGKTGRLKGQAEVGGLYRHPEGGYIIVFVGRDGSTVSSEAGPDYTGTGLVGISSLLPLFDAPGQSVIPDDDIKNDAFDALGVSP